MAAKLQRLMLDRLAETTDRRTQDLLLDLWLQYRQDEQDRDGLAARRRVREHPAVASPAAVPRRGDAGVP